MMDQGQEKIISKKGFSKITKKLASLANKESYTSLTIENTIKIDFTRLYTDYCPCCCGDNYGNESPYNFDTIWHEEGQTDGRLQDLIREFAKELGKFTGLTELTLRTKVRLVKVKGFDELQEVINEKLLKLKKINVVAEYLDKGEEEHDLEDDMNSWSAKVREGIKINLESS